MIKQYLLDALKWFNLTDRANKLSITNVAVMVLLVKIAMAPNMDWAVVAGLFVTLLNYDRKRKATQAQDSKPVEQPTPAVTEEMYNDVLKTATEAKEMASKLGLAVGFQKLK